VGQPVLVSNDPISAKKIFAIKPFPSLKVYQKYFCGLGSTSGSARGAYSAPKDPLAGFWKRRWGKEREKRKGRKSRERGMKKEKEREEDN